MTEARWLGAQCSEPAMSGPIAKVDGREFGWIKIRLTEYPQNARKMNQEVATRVLKV